MSACYTSWKKAIIFEIISVGIFILFANMLHSYPSFNNELITTLSLCSSVAETASKIKKAREEFQLDVSSFIERIVNVPIYSIKAISIYSRFIYHDINVQRETNITKYRIKKIKYTNYLISRLRTFFNLAF